MAVTHSYIRFSSKGKQSKGDSFRRQKAGEEWIARNHHTASSLRLYDLGVSSFRGQNLAPDKALGRFLDEIGGRVKPGDILLVEHLDRMSRAGIEVAEKLFKDILRAGVKIAVLTPAEHVYTWEQIENDFGALLPVLYMFHAAYEYSKNLSRRLKSVMKERRKQLREGKRPILSAKGPSWLRWDGERWVEARPGAFAAIRYIFERTVEGTGQRQLLADLVQRFKPLGTSGRWNGSFISKVLNDRAVLGEFHPKEARVPTEGGTIEGYYPRVIEDKLFERAKAVRKAKEKMKGPNGLFVNLFTGLVVNALDGSVCQLQTTHARQAKYTQRRLVSQAHKEKQAGADPLTIPLPEFEDAVLRYLNEINAADLEHRDETNELRAAQQELTAVVGRRAELVAALESPGGGSVAALQNALGKLDTRRAELLDAMRAIEARSSTAAPLAQARSVMAKLAQASGDELHKLRLRLRSYLADLVESIHVKAEKHYGRIWCAIQLNYRGGKFRSLMFGPGGQYGGSTRQIEAEERPWGGLDLRDRKAAKKNLFGPDAALVTAPAVLKVPKVRPATVGPAAEVWLNVMAAQLRPDSHRVIGPKVARFVAFAGAGTRCVDVDARLWGLFVRHLRAEVREGGMARNSALVALNRARQFCGWIGADVGRDSARAALDGGRVRQPAALSA
jgi:DNA invertase Pin-like site-specific DNA recombinase